MKDYYIPSQQKTLQNVALDFVECVFNKLIWLIVAHFPKYNLTVQLEHLLHLSSSSLTHSISSASTTKYKISIVLFLSNRIADLASLTLAQKIIHILSFSQFSHFSYSLISTPASIHLIFGTKHYVAYDELT